jgi:hypothetical protein
VRSEIHSIGPRIDAPAAWRIRRYLERSSGST